MILTLDFSTILSYGVLGILLGALVINLIPLVSPSNLILSGIFFLMLPNQHPALVGLLVAIGASIAKLLHYQFSYLMGSIFSSKINHHINPHARKLLIEWGSLGAFIAAVSPIPDDPIVFPMGFLRFNIVKFFLAYFTGKTIICLIGAYTASQISSTKIFDPKITVISIILFMFILGWLMRSKKISRRYPLLLSLTKKLKVRIQKIFESLKKI
jgi:membrane protein YqaA with SNARE-associated domain